MFGNSDQVWPWDRCSVKSWLLAVTNMDCLAGSHPRRGDVLGYKMVKHSLDQCARGVEQWVQFESPLQKKGLEEKVALKDLSECSL